MLFTGCRPEVAASGDGTILGLGSRARAAAGPSARMVELEGAALPGLIDSHLHLHWLAQGRLTVDLGGLESLDAVLARVRGWTEAHPEHPWIAGRGWYDDDWAEPGFPDRRSLDAVTERRPALLTRKDGHSAWANSAALAAAGIDRATTDPAGGRIDRDAAGEPTGILRERAIELVRHLLPEPSQAESDAALRAVLRDLAGRGLTSVHSMDPVSTFGSLQRLRARGQLPLRVVWNLPLAAFESGLGLELAAGFGDDRLRVWGVKAFLDGSLGSRTAEMLDGTGVPVLPQPALVELLRRAGAAGLNVCLHAIGDGAVRRALDAIESVGPQPGLWRPRIEHAQAVHPDDQPRFAALGVIASMQPIHAVADRELADREWRARAAYAYAWGALARAGAVLAFGSDAPVETADPLLGLDAAVGWRKRVGWHPELSLSPAEGLAAYTRGAAFAAGLERRLGKLAPGYLCDLTVVDDRGVSATVVGGRLVFRRRRRR